MIKGTKIYKVKVENGQVDPKPFNKYKDWKISIDNNDFADVDSYKAKAKANYRWMLMAQNLQKGLETLSNIDCEASSSTIPSSVEFVLTYTQPDALWIRENGEVIFEDKEQVITKIIEDTLNQEYGVILEYFSPKTYSGSKDYESPLAEGVVTEKLTVEVASPSVEVKELVDGYREFVEEDNLDEDED